MKDSTSSPPAGQRPFTGESADPSLFPPLCVYFHRTLYSPSSSFLSLRSFFLLLPSLLRRCFSPSSLSCSGESSTGRQETRKSDLKVVYLDASYILLRVYCALTNLQLQFIPLRYPSAHAAATLPAAWCDDRLLQLRQILVLLQQTRDLDALAAASSSYNVSLDAAGGLQEERPAPAATAWNAGSTSATTALGTAAAAGDRNAHNEVLGKDLAVALAAADDSDAEVLRRRLQQQSAAVAAFIEQRLGSALQYILWVYEPCRKHFTFPVYTQNLPFVYVTPLLLWARRKSLQQEQARPLKEALLDIIAVLELLDLQQLQQQVKRQRQQMEKKKKRQKQQLQGDDKQQHASFFEDTCSPAGGVIAETVQQPKSQQHLVEEEAATTVDTAPGTEAAAAEEEDEEEDKERNQCLTGLFSASEDDEEEGLQPEFLLVPEAPTLADVYLYAYLFVLLQLPSHLLPWHEEEIAAFSAAPSLALASSSSAAAATSACVGAACAVANEQGSAWLSSDASLSNFWDDASANSSAAAYQLLQQQQDKQEEHLHKKKIVRLLPLARQYLQRFEEYLFQLRGVCMSSGEATAATAAPAAAKSLQGTGITFGATSYFPPATSTADALPVEPTPPAGETAAGGAEWQACFASLPPLPVHACSAARAALYDRTLLQQQRRGSDRHSRRDKGGDDVDSTKSNSNSTKSSIAAAPVSKDNGVAASDDEAEQHSNSRDRKSKQAAVLCTSTASALHTRISCRKKGSSEDSVTRGFLALTAAAAVGALVLYIGSTTRTGYRRC